MDNETYKLACKSSAVICVAPNGARRTHSDHPHLPIGPEALADEAARCADAGATVMHLHVRDEAGGHSLDVGRYRDAMSAVENKVGNRLLIQVTTEAVGLYTAEQQMQLVRTLKPPYASVALKEFAPAAADDARLLRFIQWCGAEGIGLQFILYSPQEAQRLVAWGAGLPPGARLNALFVLGRYTAGQQSSPLSLLPFLADWPANWPWSVCAFGHAEAQCVATAIGLGGHVRVGFENNLHGPDGALAEWNADLVHNAAELARRGGRGLATVEQAKAVYGAAG